MKSKQDRIDHNSVVDLEMDRKHMIEFLQDQNRTTYDDLIIMRKHYEELCDARLLKLESAIWLILIWKEIYRRDSFIIRPPK